MSVSTNEKMQVASSAAAERLTEVIGCEAWQDRPTFLCGHRKSGTTLLLCLFDAHPQLCVFPPDSGFFYAYYPIFDGDKHTDEEKKRRIIDVMYRNFRDEFDELPALSDRSILIDKMEQRFIERMENRFCTSPVLLREAVLAFHDVFRRSGTTDTRRWMEKTTSTEIYASEVFQWYPQGKWIHLIRDPRDNFGSLKSGWGARYKDQNDETRRLLQSAVERGGLGLKLAKLNERRFGSQRYRVVRFEDLTANPESVMRGLAEFLDIDYDPCLQQPTFCGAPWRGNNFQGLQFDQPSAVNVGRWRERIDDHEAKVIEFHCGREMADWGYEPAFATDEQIDAAMQHYKWHNFAQIYSVSSGTETYAPVES